MTIFKTKDGIEYNTDEFGVIHQLNPIPYKYNSEYIDTYRNPEYREASALLMGLRLGTVYSMYINIFKKHPTSILDVGYGDGSFLESCKGAIPSINGFDITGEILASPINVLNSFPNNNHYDITTFWDVYEHLPDLSIIKNIKTGMIAMSMPDVENKDFENWKHRKPDEHIHHFTVNSLTSLMGSYGYKNIHTSWIEDTVRKSNEKNNIMTCLFIK
jgi:2-polyprenyl-3-methyl-5-hydroxy-6-metoxy-1,4-benzoquinol methylase